MKIFRSKNIFQKIIIAVVVVAITSVIIPHRVEAGDGVLDAVGGALLKPILGLLVGLGDVVMNTLQKCILGMDNSLLKITENGTNVWMWIIGAIVIVAIAVVAVASIIATAGAGAGVWAAIAGIGGITLKAAGAIAAVVIAIPLATTVSADMLASEFYLPMYEITPYEIFANRIPLFDIDFFDKHEINGAGLTAEQYNNLVEQREKNTAYQIKNIVAAWYTRLRTVAIVGLLSVLIYLGIRMLISSAAKDKAKYKQFLVDWLVAMCLLFSMHYMMTFSVKFTKKIIDAIDIVEKDAAGNTKGTGVEFFDIQDKNGRVENAYKALTQDKDGNTVNSFYEGYFEKQGDKPVVLHWPTYNFMQQSRMKFQILNEDGSESWVSAGYAFIFVILVIDTLIYSYTYVRRIIYMAFLTMIAPLVALTYPIDKANDGSAQAFNAWFKEYIFNLLIQPLHLLLYMVLVGSAMAFAASNPIYAVIAVSFMIPAEKLLRQFFGFQKASTPGALPGSAGGALMMEGIHKLTGWGPHRDGNSNKNEGSGDKEKDEAGKIRTKNNNPYEALGSDSGETGNLVEQVDQTSDNSVEPVEQTSDNSVEQVDQATDDSVEQVDQTSDNSVEQVDQATDDSVEQVDQATDDSVEQVDQATDDSVEQVEQTSDNLGEQVDQTSDNSAELADQSVDTTQRRRINNNHLISQAERRRLAAKRRRQGLNGIRRYMKSRGTGYLKGQHRKIRNKAIQNVKNHPWRRGAKFAGKIFGGLLGAGVGLAVGAATGDPSKAFQNTVIGAKGGSNLAKGTTDFVFDTLSVDGAQTRRKKAQAAYYGDDYKDYLMDKYAKDWLKNDENIDKLEMHFPDTYNDLIKDGVIHSYLENGFDDVDEIIAIEDYVQSDIKKNMENNPDITVEEAREQAMEKGMAVGKISDNIGDWDNLGAKGQKEAYDTLFKNFKESNENLRQEMIRRHKNEMEKIVKDNEKFREGLEREIGATIKSELKKKHPEFSDDQIKEAYKNEMDNKVYEKVIGERYEARIKEMCNQTVTQIKKINDIKRENSY